MATGYSAQTANNVATPPVRNPATDARGKVRCNVDVITLASQLAADITVLQYLPIGARFLYGLLLSDTSLGSTTIQIGITGTTAKYKADATFTTTDLSVLFGKAAANAVLTAADQPIITYSTATAPSSGTLTVMMFYTVE